MKKILLSLIVSLLGVLILPAAEEAEAPKATTIEDVSIPPEYLDLKLDPLTLKELEVEAQAWHSLVRAEALKVAEAAIATRKAAEGSEEKKNSFEAMEEARKKQDALMERLEVVLTSWEEKGGDPAEMRLYLQALKGIKVELTDASSLAELVRRWFTSADGGGKWGLKVLLFLFILASAWIISGIVSRLVRKAMASHRQSSELLDNFVHKISRRIILLIGLMIALSTMGVNVSAVLALMGGGAFIIGFAMQDTLSNFANGIMLMFYRPFDVGDFVEVGGVSGTIRSVSLVSTEITTPDNKVILVPNKQVWGQTITNATRSKTRRVDLVFGIAYDDDADKAAAVLERIVTGHDLILDTPEHTIKVHELADSSVNLICRPWVKTEDYWAVYWDLMKQVKDAFDAENITFPFPARDVFVHNIGEGNSGA